LSNEPHTNINIRNCYLQSNSYYIVHAARLISLAHHRIHHICK